MKTRLLHYLRLLPRVGWPVLAGASLVLLGLVLLIAAARFQWQASQLILSSAPASNGRNALPPSPNIRPGSDSGQFTVPAQGSHLEDVAKLFRLAKDQGVAIGSIEYRAETNPALPILIRTLDLRIHEEYPKLKAFVASLLSSMPHVFLQEIQVEQGNGKSSKEQITLKLSFVYQSAAKTGTPERKGATR